MSELEPIETETSPEDEKDLLNAFEDSAEARGLRDIRWVDMADDYADQYFGERVDTLNAEQLREIVFQLFPEKVSCKPSAAASIVEQLRAFYAFVAREKDPERGAACIAVFDGDAAERLERELSDPRNFGMAKSFVMRGMESGFDMTTDAGIASFAGLYNGALSAPPRRSAPSPADRARKNKRKAERKARRKNR